MAETQLQRHRDMVARILREVEDTEAHRASDTEAHRASEDLAYFTKLLESFDVLDDARAFRAFTRLINADNVSAARKRAERAEAEVRSLRWSLQLYEQRAAVRRQRTPEQRIVLGLKRFLKRIGRWT